MRVLPAIYPKMRSGLRFYSSSSSTSTPPWAITSVASKREIDNPAEHETVLSIGKEKSLIDGVVKNPFWLEKYISVNRKIPRYTLSADLSHLLEGEPFCVRCIHIVVRVSRVNGEIPPIKVISGNCDVSWADSEIKRMDAINCETHEHQGINVTLKGGHTFAMEFGQDVYVDDVYQIKISQEKPRDRPAMNMTRGKQ